MKIEEIYKDNSLPDEWNPCRHLKVSDGENTWFVIVHSDPVSLDDIVIMEKDAKQ